jgi:phosphatidylinositol glycan class B
MRQTSSPAWTCWWTAAARSISGTDSEKKAVAVTSSQMWPDARFIRRLLALTLALYLATAWFSEGFHHADEHFQVLEFASYKLGKTPANELPWEFRQQVRPWLQPAVAYGVANLTQSIGIESPFAWAFLLRALAALLAWCALVRLLRCSERWFTNAALGKSVAAAACFLWFLPYLAARFSSEGLAASLFTLGFTSLILRVQNQRLPDFEIALAGLAMAFAFHVRYQAAILILFGLAWYFWRGKPGRLQATSLGFGLASGLAIGFAVDAWGYGAWTFAPWNYFSANLIQGKAAQFGTAPPWAYLEWFLMQAMPPISALLLAGVLCCWVRKPGFSLTWVTLPFVLVHATIGHKEMRFLFPIAIFLPFMAGLALQSFAGHDKWLEGRAVKEILIALACLNAVALFVRSAYPAREDIGLLRAIHAEARLPLYYEGARSPYELTPGLQSRFYRPDGLAVSAGPPLAVDHLLATPPFDVTRSGCSIVYPADSRWPQMRPLRSLLLNAPPREWTLARCRVR